MNQEIKKIAVSQYMKSFLWLFIILGVLFVGTIITFVKSNFFGGIESTRNNTQSITGRIFDYADIFSQEEEIALSEEITKIEDEIQCDIIIVSISQMVEGEEAAQMYGYRYNSWEYNMRDIADDFYDNNLFGYDMPHGDGVLFLTNDLGARDGHVSQKGTWLSTSGRAESKMSSSDIDDVLDAIDDVLYYDSSANYKAHLEGIRAFRSKMRRGSMEETGSTIYMIAFIAPIIIGIIFFLANYKSKEGKVTVNANTYVEKNGMAVRNQQDIFVNKVVTKRRIESSSGGGGGSHGGGGHHTSSGGHSHGGGGHRR